ncbi:MAG: response regulator [Taibaiella sp.]|nr:response regulator [Taibaiella sp.]
MANVKVGIVEDEMIIAQGIADALEQLGYAVTEPAVSYTEALEMTMRETPDILLIDIQLSGKKDGIDLAWKIKEDYNIPFIFLTANSDSETVNRAKKVSPHAYLLKPFDKEDLYTSIEICLHNFSQSQKEKATVEKDNYLIKDHLFIKQGVSLRKIAVADILYLESDNVYIYIYANEAKLVVRSTIQNYLDLIGSDKFFRVHRSFAVNISRIDVINTDTLLINEKEIPIGKVYRSELLTMLRLG